MRFSSTRKATAVIKTAAMALAVSLLAGCDVKSFLDPSEVGRFKHDPLLVPILNKLDTGFEESDSQFSSATDVRPEDLVPSGRDYIISRNDLLQIGITDLVGPGVETVKAQRVSETGNISLPLVGQIEAAGQTEPQLEKRIADAYRNANYISNAQVTVTVAEARGKTFSIWGPGTVTTPGEYSIVRADFRLLDALVLAHQVEVPGVDYIYIVRKPQTATPEATTQPSTTGQPAGGPGPEILAPHSQIDLLSPDHPVLLQTAPKTTPPPTHLEMRSAVATAAPAAGPTTTASSEGRYVIVDGKPVLMQPSNAPAVGAIKMGETTHSGSATPVPTTQGFEFKQEFPASEERIIRIPYSELGRGDMRYNVVIRPGDLIMVPPPVSGVYYMGGHVARVGVYEITGRQIDLKQAVIAAGMLDAVAIPQRTDVIRRIGPDKEVFVRVDLDAIFEGRQPDFYLKPNDQVLVGTNIFAPFLAAIRGGFRITYGFGFLYDRNFAPVQPGAETSGRG